jgi:hypothetical protein
MATQLTIGGTVYTLDDVEVSNLIDQVAAATLAKLPSNLTGFDLAALKADIEASIQTAVGAVTLAPTALDALTLAVEARLADEFTNVHDHIDANGQAIETRIETAQTALAALLTEQRLTDIVAKGSKRNTSTFVGFVVLLLLVIGGLWYYGKVRADGIETRLSGFNLSTLTLEPDPSVPGGYTLVPGSTSTVKAPTTPSAAPAIPTAAPVIVVPSAPPVAPTAPAVPSAIPTAAPTAPAVPTAAPASVAPPTLTKADCITKCTAKFKAAGIDEVQGKSMCEAAPACASLP